MYRTDVRRIHLLFITISKSVVFGASSVIAFIALTHPCIAPPLLRLLTLGHNYVNSRPILLVPRSITFHLVSFERVCNVPCCDSNYWRRCWGYQIHSIKVGGRRPAAITHHTLTKNTSTMTNPGTNHGIIGSKHPIST